MPSNHLNDCEPAEQKNNPFRIEDALLIHKIQYDRLDGTMKREDRSKALEALKLDPRCEVLLVSLKAGGVGLNLTAAQRVILMDPCWYVSTFSYSLFFFGGFPDFSECVLLNSILIFFLCVVCVVYRNPAVENQAVDRIVSFKSTRKRIVVILKKKHHSFCSPTASVGSNKTRFFDKVHHFTFH